MHSHFFDTLPIGWLFLLTLVLMMLMLELGYRLGTHKGHQKVKAQTAQVRALMGATLGLLALMLAFTFSSAKDHFESRIQFQIDETVLAKKAFMQADLAGDPVRTQARALLQEFVEGRVKLIEMVREKEQEEIFRLVNRADEIHMQLWSLGSGGDVKEDTEFTGSVLGLMEMQTRRVQAALANRIPLIIWLALYLTAVMSMTVVGYQAGLTEKRSPVATFSLALAFSTVMMLIMDLDRPLQSLFEMDIAVMQQLAEFMHSK